MPAPLLLYSSTPLMDFVQGLMIRCGPICLESLCLEISVWTRLHLHIVNLKGDSMRNNRTLRTLTVRVTLLASLVAALTVTSARLQADAGTCGARPGHEGGCGRHQLAIKGGSRPHLPFGAEADAKADRHSSGREGGLTPLAYCKLLGCGASGGQCLRNTGRRAVGA